MTEPSIWNKRGQAQQGAEQLVRDLIVATTEYTKAANSSHGTKGVAKRERKAAKAILEALTGQRATDEQLDRICIL